MAFIPLPKLYEPGFSNPGEPPPSTSIIDGDNWAAAKRIFYFPLLNLRGDFFDGNYRNRNLFDGLGTPLQQKGVTLTGTDFSFNRNLLSLNKTSNATKFGTPTGVKELAGDLDYTYFIRMKTGPFVSQGSSVNTIFSYNQYQICQNSSRQLRVLVPGGDTTYSSVDTSAMHTIALSLNSTTSTVTVYVDSVELSPTISMSAPPADSSKSLVLGGDDGAIRECNCDIEFAGVLSGAVNASQVKSLIDDPYQLLAPAAPPIYFTTSGVAPPVGGNLLLTNRSIANFSGMRQ